MDVTEFVIVATLKNTSEAVLTYDIGMAYRGWCMETGENATQGEPDSREFIPPLLSQIPGINKGGSGGLP